MSAGTAILINAIDLDSGGQQVLTLLALELIEEGASWTSCY